MRGRIATSSMRARMTLWLALVIAFFMVTLSAAYLLYTRDELENHFAASLDLIAPESARLARRGASLDELRADIEAHNARVARSGAISEAVAAWLVDGQGKSVWRSGPLGPPHHGSGGGKPDHQDGKHGGQPSDADDVGAVPPLDDPGGWRTRQLNWEGQKLVLALPWRRAQSDLRAQASALIALSLLVTATAAFGAWMLVGQTLRPIGALAEQARASAQNPMQLMEERMPLQPTSRDVEMRNLVATLNQMLDNVREAALSKERFHTSASHELRTPLQALSGHLGVALSRERSASEYRGALEEAARQTARLSKLTGDLLLLNRLQTAASAPPTEAVDVAEVCDIALQRAYKTIEERALKVVDRLDALEVEATPSHVEILLGNLVENAAKYARAGGEVGVEIDGPSRSVRVWNEWEAGQWAELHSDLPRLFEPFYRPDLARTSDTGGNGLGLAICHSIAEGNGWTLSIEADQQRFGVRVEF